MCNLCKGDGTYCQDCGKEICFDCKSGDDFRRPAYVTASGDLYCDRCGSRMDEAEERDYEYDYDPHEIDEVSITEVTE